MAALKHPIPKPFHVVAKPFGSICNLDCKYCYYLEKERLHPQVVPAGMSQAVLDQFIEQYISSQPTDVVHFLWQGGEPTLAGIEFFREAVRLQARYRGDRQVTNAVQTNGTTLNEEFCRFFHDNQFLVGVSIDGPSRLHDQLRLSKGQKPTLHQTVLGIELLRRYEVEFNLLCVVHRENANHAQEVYEYLKEVGGRYLQFIPLVEREQVRQKPVELSLVPPQFQGESRLMEWSVSAEQYGRFLIDVFELWKAADIGKVFVQIFDVTLENWLGREPSLCIFRTTCGDAVAIERTGDVYACDHYVFPEFHLGNVTDTPLAELLALPKQREFGAAKQAGLPRQCRECPVYFACKGECPKNRFIVSKDGEAGLNYLCQGYLAFFQHVAPFMDTMARTIDPRFNSRRICPLGSSDQRE